MTDTKLGLSKLALEAGLGTRIWNSYSYLAARYFHYIIGAFFVGIIALTLSPQSQPRLTLLVLTIFAAHFMVRMIWLWRNETSFYQTRVQIIRTQVDILGIFLLMCLLPVGDDQQMLWVLYILPILTVSRHCRTAIFSITTIEICLLIIIAGWRNGALPALTLGAILQTPHLTVMLLGFTMIAFIIHYLIRNIDARDAIISSFEAIEALSERAGINRQPSERWKVVLETYLKTLQGVCGELWLCNHDTRSLRQLHEFRYCRGDACAVDHADCATGPIKFSEDHPLAQVVKTGQPLFCLSKSPTQAESASKEEPAAARCPLPDNIYARIAVPVFDTTTQLPQTLGVLCIDFERKSAPKPYLLQDYYDFIAGLARRVRPILHHMQQIEELQTLHQLGRRVSSTLTLNMIVEDAVDAIVKTIGFEFATISLVDPQAQVIRTIAGKNVPAEWIRQAEHPLASPDIQADIVRTGRQEEISGWDDRFDQKIWSRFNHQAMVRVFTPISGLGSDGERRVTGTLEAGYFTQTKSRISADKKWKLMILARHLFTAIENATLFSKTEEWAESLAKLHQIGWKVALARDLSTVLDEVGTSLSEVLSADIVMLYRYDRKSRRLDDPRIFGEIYGPHKLRLPSPDEGVVGSILSTSKPYYSANAAVDERLVDAGDSGGKHRSFTKRQKIRSFAGVPMIASGEVVGVLCVNYRRPHLFSEKQRQVLELAAQFAAVAIHNAETNELTEELIANTERMRLATRLHNSLSQYLPAIRVLAETAVAHLNGHRDEPWAKVAAKLDQIMAATRSANNEVRINVFELNAKTLADCDLAEVLQDYAHEAKAYFDLKVDLEVEPTLQAQIPTPIARDLLLVCREGLANIAKHAEAAHVDLQLRVHGQWACLLIRDDGCGFDYDQVQRYRGGGRGLKMMRDHIEQLHGTLEVESLPDQGTVIKINVPLYQNGGGKWLAR